MTRYRQVHDIWHILCDLPPDVPGEIALKWFELLQTGLPSAGLSAVFGPLRLSLREQARLVRFYIPWALRSAAIARPLMCVYYEELLELPLNQVQSQLHIEPFR